MAKKFSEATVKAVADFADPATAYLMGVNMDGSPDSFRMVRSELQKLIVAGSNTQIQFNNAGAFGASSNLTWSGTTLAASQFRSDFGSYFWGSSSDVVLARDAADVLAQRRGATAQEFAVYNTYSSATSFERGVIDWKTTSNVLRIGTEKGTTGGTARGMQLVTDGVERIGIDATGKTTISSTTFPVVDVRRSTSATNIPVAGPRFVAVSTGDMSDGFGPQVFFNIRDTAGVDNDIASLGAVRDGGDATGALIFRTIVGAGSPTERVRISADGVTTFSSDQIRIATSKTPSSSTDTGVTGTICWDANYVYVAVGTNQWKRAALSTW